MPNGDSTDWITTVEAAELTGYTIVHLARLVRGKNVVGMKRGRDWFVSKADLLAYKARMDALGTDKHSPWRDDLTAQGRGRGVGTPVGPAL